ncbi:MAG TPA: cellulase family glycosylhydrolase, partial [Solirubrobacteraceae bacterium]
MRRLVGALALAGALLVVSSMGPAARAATPATPRLPALHAVDDPVDGGRIVDAQGRQVLLRGVNVNSLGEYWKGTSFATTFPVMNGDPQIMQGLGWNTVRLVLSWSKVEPARGVSNEAYLNQAAALVDRFAEAGMYTVIDLHQDAWGATLAARFGERCQAPAKPGIGWDGAPAWATLVPDDVPRCFTGTRERNPAVIQAWASFFANAQGVEDAYVGMWGHIAQRFATSTPVAGFDVMNEPNAFEAQSADLTKVYSRSLTAIRAGER